MASLLTKDIEQARYAPVLSIRPAEMKALEELPEVDKEHMLPLILLRPWLRAESIEQVLAKIEEAFSKRSILISIDSQYDADATDKREVITTLNSFKNSAKGYDKWCSFIEENENFIPCARLADSKEVPAELQRLSDLGRGVGFHIEYPQFKILDNILNVIVEVDIANGVLFVLDYGQTRSGDLFKVADAISQIKSIKLKIPEAKIILCGTSFPDSFGQTTDQEIFERTFFNEVRSQIDDELLLYGDHGSANRSIRGGGGAPIVPRIDYPTLGKWHFSRTESGYKAAAEKLKKNKSVWKDDLRIWGTQMIERTTLGDKYAITSPARSTAARINIHLHTQIYYDDPSLIISNTEDDWSD